MTGPDRSVGTDAARDPVELLEGIMTARAMRRFTAEPVSDDDIWTVLAAAQQAPSGGNVQPWQFVVVRDPDVRRHLGDLYRRAYDRYEAALLPTVGGHRSEADAASWERTLAASRHLAEHFGEVPVVVAVCQPDLDLTLSDADGPLDIGPLSASVFPAVQNLILAARSLGLGAALTTVFRIHHDEVRQLLAVPDHHQVVALVPLGHPVGRFAVARRRPVERVTSWDRWGERRPRP
jgi:nitroreductase